MHVETKAPLYRRTARLGVYVGIGLALAANPRAGSGQEAVSVLPGNGMVVGSALTAYDASWQSRDNQTGEWQDRAVITEALTVEGDRWVRVQETKRPAWGVQTRVEMDRATLRPLFLRRTLLPNTPQQVMDQLAANGFVKELEIHFNGASYETHTTAFDGTTDVKRGEIGEPFFDGSILGLVIAALPLKDGYEARIPILFVDGRAGDVTPYWVEASVIGSEPVNGKDAMRVDVGWAEFDSGVVTSAPGPEAAGGAYWITKNAGGDVPPVPRYRNENVDIVVSSGAMGDSHH